MVTYTAHERDSEARDIAARAEAIVFVKEGFAWLALLVPLLWLLYHRMWIVLAGYAASVVLVQLGVLSLGLADGVAIVMTISLSGLLALQANDLRRWSLARKGYQMVELVRGRDRDECEERFFTRWLASQTEAVPRAVKRVPASAGNSSPGVDDVIGLFPEPGK